MYNLQQIAEITNSKFIGGTNNKVSIFLNDSRALQSPADTLFIALKTARNNGHNYIADLIEKGVRSFLIQENEFDISKYKNADVSFVVSANPLRAIQQLAAFHRKQFTIPVIGITGSNGKTVVKEWLYQLLKSNFSICRSPKSYNSQIGVPLSVLNLNHTHTLAIFEAGISLPNEMDALVEIINPTIGVFTSIGTAHDEGFESREQKINEKLKLIARCDKKIINGLHKEQLPDAILSKSLLVSEFDDADLKISFKDETLELKSPSAAHQYKIPFSDKASILNASTCAATLMQLGFKEADIAQRLTLLQPVALRLEIKTGINNALIINDYYNSDIDSIKIALNYLSQQNRRLRKIVIVSDLEQSGISANTLYKQLAELFLQNKIDLVVGIGKEISNHKPLFKANSLFFFDTQSFINQFKLINYQFSEASILLKGARSFGFENISRVLQLKSHDTVFEINLNKLINNINYYRSLIAPNVKLMCMVKAMGYGSGGAEIAKTLQHIGVNYLAVAYADEGVELRQSQITLPIMVMSPEDDALEDIINYQLEPEIYSFKVLHAFVKKLDALGITEPYPVHLKIDTGMHRLGFEEKDLEALVLELKNLPQLKVRSVFSHLVGTDNSNLDDFTNEQMRVFEKVFSAIELVLGYSVLKHICNSGGITRFKNAHYNMVRLGIGMYGIGVNGAEQAQLENVGSLITRISQIKNVSASQTVGYNRNGKLDKETKIATIPIGYADGFNRLLGNGNHGVYINGKFCKTIGNICMDMCMVDISHINCHEGDEVIIFENTEQINAMAAALNSISYEVLTNVSARVKRVYVQE
ncbi:MAG: bifunctional UDP-N-acetylmuramoyl-tripeptide:D-alanyl-D-alanine ligase/alanine racemase [Bacteroidetes bacterium]|nr:bifunctional UDP-N-acetylmuramoyl-tripeptide:D-alanyl-D-alanine ligase/alanine racemase [Bacteroidota bacterium]